MSSKVEEALGENAFSPGIENCTGIVIMLLSCKDSCQILVAPHPMHFLYCVFLSDIDSREQDGFKNDAGNYPAVLVSGLMSSSVTSPSTCLLGHILVLLSGRGGGGGNG